jgi:hypothetical protein
MARGPLAVKRAWVVGRIRQIRQISKDAVALGAAED